MFFRTLNYYIIYIVIHIFFILLHTHTLLSRKDYFSEYNLPNVIISSLGSDKLGDYQADFDMCDCRMFA